MGRVVGRVRPVELGLAVTEYGPRVVPGCRDIRSVHRREALQLLCPVEDNDEAAFARFRRRAEKIFRPDTHEPLTVWHDVQSPHRRRRARAPCSIQGQRHRVAESERRYRRHAHACEELRPRHVEERSTIRRPDRMMVVIRYGHLILGPSRRKRLYEDLVLASFVGLIRQPSPVGRKHRL